MGNIHKLLTRMKRTKKEFDEKMDKHISDLDKLREIIKYNYRPNKSEARNVKSSSVVGESSLLKQVQTGSDNFYLDLTGEQQ